MFGYWLVLYMIGALCNDFLCRDSRMSGGDGRKAEAGLTWIDRGFVSSPFSLYRSRLLNTPPAATPSLGCPKNRNEPPNTGGYAVQIAKLTQISLSLGKRTSPASTTSIAGTVHLHRTSFLASETPNRRQSPFPRFFLSSACHRTIPEYYSSP